MIVKTKFNYANRLAAFVLQAVKDNKQRHEQLQRFFIANDSCTVATEVPVYIRREDIIHMENDLRFKITDDGKVEIKGNKKPVEMPKLLTGHIDFIQIRNGQVHLMDYKPDAAKEKPIEQLTWYALAMCRLTGLRLYDFTCSWFDDKDFFQFYPLHVVKKLRGKSRKNRKIFFKDGTWAETSSKKDKLVVVGRDRDDSLETKF
jgi:ATP-dependent exoDNAse (exonuclease V) beta subunit